MMSRIGQFFGRMGLATLSISPNRNSGGGVEDDASQTVFHEIGQV